MASIKSLQTTKKEVTEILNDYRLACESREVSLLGRKEVFMGKAKFGIFGDGKEIAQIAMAKVFKPGDFRSGYYRDQTFMFAISELTVQQYFAQLYAHADVAHEPVSGGRLMNSHFATRMLDDEGKLKPVVKMKNSSSDISPTAGQMPRLVGLAYASKLFRENESLSEFTDLSHNGDEIAFGTIGNASTSEGLFFEAINAAGVLQIPMVVSVWDDGYGISVPNEYHTTKSSISKALEGFRRDDENKGLEIMEVRGWDYPALCATYAKASKLARQSHVPVLIHVTEMTQPQGHSTSGSHERYKSQERLTWENDYDCIKKMREWLLSEEIVVESELAEIEKEAKKTVRQAKNRAWEAFSNGLKKEREEAVALMVRAAEKSPREKSILRLKAELDNTINPIKMDVVKMLRKALRLLRGESSMEKNELLQWLDVLEEKNKDIYNSHLYSESEYSALKVPAVPARIPEGTKPVDGRELLNAFFDAALDRDPKIFAFGEDVGRIGDVNQAFAGLQEKYGELRVTDTGIREVTIIGQGIGAALRGLRPIAEIQYLDYLVYALMVLTDDLACLQYRTKGGQKAPLIVRTRGHRLEGVWHSGSPMSMMIHSLRGIFIAVPRNMTQAAGFYNTLLQSDDAGIVIECLNGYRLKEKIPANIDSFTVPLGVPEVLKEGTDVTIVTYGAMCRIIMEASRQLTEAGISCEVIDVQTLLPFDRYHRILESLKKTNRIIFADEDMPGGATAYMMQEVLEKQNGYYYLDSKPLTITGKEHRPAYASDGDYFSKPNPEGVFDIVYKMMSESEPEKFPHIYQ